MKKPDLQANGQIKRVKPVALVHATTLCSNSPVNLVCLGMKTTECLTFALALEIDVPMVKKLARCCGLDCKAHLMSCRVSCPHSNLHKEAMASTRELNVVVFLLFLVRSKLFAEKCPAILSFKHRQGHRKPRLKLCS